MTDRDEQGYKWAWNALVEELDGRIACYADQEAGLHPEARGWLGCLQHMRRKTKALARRMKRESTKLPFGEITERMWNALHEDGETHCPCCGRYMKVYRRSIHHEMAYFLIWLVHHYEAGAEWSHISSFPRSRSGDYAKLMFWNLIEPKPHEDDSQKRSSGWWRPTKDGIAFAHSRAAVPRHALVFDNELQRLTGGHIFIREALGKHFVYEEVLQSVQDTFRGPSLR